MKNVMTIRKKPVVVSGMRWDGTLKSAKEICAWVNKDIPKCEDPIADYTYVDENDKDIDFRVWTKEGQMKVVKNAVVIKGVEGEFYPCKPSVFERTYDILTDVKMEGI